MCVCVYVRVCVSLCVHTVLNMALCTYFILMQRIATSTRNGGPNELCLERYVEALSDSTSGLTYPALTGSRKQSVVDAERLFSPSLAKFMEKRGYDFEANYIRVIWNWRRSCDERGLTELQRCRFNYQMLNYVLDDLCRGTKIIMISAHWR